MNSTCVFVMCCLYLMLMNSKNKLTRKHCKLCALSLPPSAPLSFSHSSLSPPCPVPAALCVQVYMSDQLHMYAYRCVHRVSRQFQVWFLSPLPLSIWGSLPHRPGTFPIRLYYLTRNSKDPSVSVSISLLVWWLQACVTPLQWLLACVTPLQSLQACVTPLQWL